MEQLNLEHKRLGRITLDPEMAKLSEVENTIVLRNCLSITNVSDGGLLRVIAYLKAAW